MRSQEERATSEIFTLSGLSELFWEDIIREDELRRCFTVDTHQCRIICLRVCKLLPKHLLIRDFIKAVCIILGMDLC